MNISARYSVFSSQQKAKVALEAVRWVKTINEIAQEFGVHPTQVGLWKKELQEQTSSLFDARRGRALDNIFVERL